jgi:hypothetical protein
VPIFLGGLMHKVSFSWLALLLPPSPMPTQGGRRVGDELS